MISAMEQTGKRVPTRETEDFAWWLVNKSDAPTTVRSVIEKSVKSGCSKVVFRTQIAEARQSVYMTCEEMKYKVVRKRQTLTCLLNDKEVQMSVVQQPMDYEKRLTLNGSIVNGVVGTECVVCKNQFYDECACVVELKCRDRIHRECLCRLLVSNRNSCPECGERIIRNTG